MAIARGRRRDGSRLVLYGLVALVILWLVGPFVWLFVTSVSYQKNLMARPLAIHVIAGGSASSPGFSALAAGIVFK